MIEFKAFDESWNSSGGFNITPLLDVIFILLIFFLLTASIANPVISVDLPETVISERSDAQEIVVSITGEGELYLNGEKKNRTELVSDLTALYAELESSRIFIESDESVVFGEVIRIMDLCSQSGVSDISFIVEEKAVE
jgi:biopolymer transport protein ExbD